MKDIIQEILLKECGNNYHVLSSLIKSTIGIRESEINSFSKFGGKPDFPVGINQDILYDKKHVFLCQLYTKDFTEINQYHDLLDEGILYFFLNPKFIYPISDNDFKVIYVNNLKEDKIVSSNIDNHKTTFMEFYSHYNFPSYQNYQIEELEKKGIDVYSDIEEVQEEIDKVTNHTPDNEGSQIFGNPQAVQGTVMFHWAAKYLNLESPFSDDEIKKIRKHEKDFVLLLQIDFSSININENFGDGVAYFGIRREDIINRNFENVMFEYQST